MHKLSSRGRQQRLTFARTGALLALAACTSAATAADADEISYRFNGFATIGAVHSSEHLADFTQNLTRPSGAGYSRNWSPNVDSRIGGQFSADVGPKWSAVLQVVSEQNWDGSFTPHVEWANLKYAFTPDFSVRVGRISLPVYLFSESRKVGYTMQSVRSATYFYTLLPISANDGIDASYRLHAGGVTSTTTLMVGHTRFTVADGSPAGIPVETHKSAGFTNRTEYGDLTLQLSRFRTIVDIPKIAAIPVPPVAALGDNAPYTFTQAGLSYDPGQWYLLGEWGKDSAPFLGSRRGWYLSAGYRLGKVSPYMIYERERQLTPSPGFFGNPQLDTPSVGARWDVSNNVDVKLQYDHNKLGPGAYGPLVNLQPKFVAGRTFSVISLVADIVF